MSTQSCKAATVLQISTVLGAQTWRATGAKTTGHAMAYSDLRVDALRAASRAPAPRAASLRAPGMTDAQTTHIVQAQEPNLILRI